MSVYVAVREVVCTVEHCRYRKLLWSSEPLVCQKNVKHGEMVDAPIVGMGGRHLVDVCPACGWSDPHDGPDEDPNGCPRCDDRPHGVEMLIVAVAKR